MRELIGIDGIITLHERRMAVDPDLCWVDAWAFERFVERSDSWQREDYNKKPSCSSIEFLEKATEIYKGQFLVGDIELPWVIPFAKCLRNKYIRCVIDLGLYREERGEIDESINCCQKGLNVDPTTEEFYQRLMICYQRLGHKTKAMDIYEQYQNKVSGIFGREVAEETKAIYKAERKKRGG